MGAGFSRDWPQEPPSGARRSRRTEPSLLAVDRSRLTHAAARALAWPKSCGTRQEDRNNESFAPHATDPGRKPQPIGLLELFASGWAGTGCKRSWHASKGVPAREKAPYWAAATYRSLPLRLAGTSPRDPGACSSPASRSTGLAPAAGLLGRTQGAGPRPVGRLLFEQLALRLVSVLVWLRLCCAGKALAVGAEAGSQTALRVHPGFGPQL